jgi:hypothetical protein
MFGFLIKKSEALRRNWEDEGIAIVGLAIFGISDHGSIIEAAAEGLIEGWCEQQGKEQAQNNR